MRKSIPFAFSLLLVSTLVAMPALGANAGADKMKACAAAWNTMPAAQKQATTYQQYSSDCMSGKAAAAPVSQQDRMKTCAAEWDKLKAAGKTGGQTYQQYSSSCLKS